MTIINADQFTMAEATKRCDLANTFSRNFCQFLPTVTEDQSSSSSSFFCSYFFLFSPSFFFFFSSSSLFFSFF
jgi:hypothetical protein